MKTYQVAKLVNFRLAEEGLDKVTPQQVYGARGKGAPDLQTNDEILAFIESYVAKRRSLANGGTGRGKSVDPVQWFAQNTQTESDDDIVDAEIVEVNEDPEDAELLALMAADEQPTE